MSFFEKFEHRIENVIGGVFDRFGKKSFKPVDLITALRNEMNNNAIEVKNGRQVVPNLYNITLSEADYNELESWGASEFADDLVASLEDNRISEGYSILGEIVVSFEENIENTPGVYQITSEAKRDEISNNNSILSNNFNLKNNDFDSEDEYKYNSVVIDAERYFLTEPVTVFGRGSTCDIIIDDSSISREHFEIRISDNNVIATDLKSTNGVFIDGNKTKAGSLHDGSVIAIGKKIIIYNSKKSRDANNIMPNNISDPNRIDSHIEPNSDSRNLTPNPATKVQNEVTNEKQNETVAKKPKSFFMTSDISPLVDDHNSNNSKVDEQNNDNSIPDPFDEIELSKPIISKTNHINKKTTN